MNPPKSEHPPPADVSSMGEMGRAMHYYQFNIGDYQSHTSHLDPIEDLAYRRMLDWCYLHEKPLPIDANEIARLIRLRDDAASVRDVLNEFFTRHDDGWVCQRVLEEINHFKQKIEQASRAGKASAERRFNARSTDVQLNNNHKPITNNHEPVVITAQPESGKAVAIATAKTKGTRLTSDWQLPKASGEWALSEGFTREMVLFEADKFRDYWISKSGRDAVKLDWDATWRNWIRNSKTNIKKTFAEQKQDYMDEKAKKFYEPLLTMTDQERKEWGFQ